VTRDIDFSTERAYGDFDSEKFRRDMDRGLLTAIDSLPYGLACRVQSWEVRPPKPDATFQTLIARIGYAPRIDTRRMRRFQGPHGSLTKLDLEISFNERLYAIEMIGDGNVDAIPAYALTELVGEKFRAILQQPIRNRIRRQDSLDIYLLLHRPELHSTVAKIQVLQILKIKCESRNTLASRESMRDIEVRRCSQKEYPKLADEIDFELPDFDMVFDAVTHYYESLPW